MFATIVILAILSVLNQTDANYQNTFEATRGCLKYNSYQGYNFEHPYFSTGAFRNVRKRPDNTIELRIGILGKNDGHVRLAPAQYPYDRTSMHEFVLSGWANTRSVIRRYIRTGPATTTGQIVLRDQSSLGLLSEYDPLMITLAIHPDGSVEFTKDHDSVPFLEFRDTTLSLRYISFCNWDVPVIYFFDCPII